MIIIIIILYVEFSNRYCSGISTTFYRHETGIVLKLISFFLYLKYKNFILYFVLKLKITENYNKIFALLTPIVLPVFFFHFFPV